MMNNLWLLLPLPLAFILDAVLGDPARLYHPVQLAGACIAGLEKVLRRIFPATPRGERAAGILLAAVIPLAFGAGFFLLLTLARGVHRWLWLCLEIFWGSQTLAAKGLAQSSMAVHRELEKGDLPAARIAVGRIVGRDTAGLSPAQVAKAAVETVAENTSDGVVAPLLYLAVGGVPLAMWYKAVNTLDSMVGYKNDRYLHFGRASARLDDLVNWLPARLSALFLLTACLLPGYDGPRALKIYRRDRRNHPSPNSAHTEAVCAGALGIQLGGGASYFGKQVAKPTIGDPVREIKTADIPRTVRLMGAASYICLLAGCLLRAALLALFF